MSGINPVIETEVSSWLQLSSFHNVDIVIYKNTFLKNDRKLSLSFKLYLRCRNRQQLKKQKLDCETHVKKDEKISFFLHYGEMRRLCQDFKNSFSKCAIDLGPKNPTQDLFELTPNA